VSGQGQPTLDCQDCGNVVRKLTGAEAQEVAANPYNFVVYCHVCKAVRQREYEGRHAWR
jgi:hypothetical protein